MKRTLSSTDVRKTMRPGDPGTSRHLRDWGARLVCVWHRVNRAKGVRFTTVEIVASAERVSRPKRKPHPDALVYARVGPDEWELERRLRNAKAATFDPFLNVWRMRYETAVRLRLKRRLMLRRPERRTGFATAPRTSENSNIPAQPSLAIPAHSRQDHSKFE
jgi:hypothetical protein